ncbi:hypothetical protein C8J32_10435 [Rhizobium sp. PP-CC-3A-592]|nr:hypothetical protein C8J32_10435 [Rhizobium sp. PP-CC-3A-592]
MGTINGVDVICQKCGSRDIEIRGFTISPGKMKGGTIKCLRCGHTEKPE